MGNDFATLIVDGCAFSEGNFSGCSEEILKSPVDSFFLTLPNSEKGFTETIRSIGNIYNLADKENNFIVANSYSDLAKAKIERKKSIILSFQDPYPIGQSLDNLRVFFELGVRVVQLTYNKANYIGTGCTETFDRGLTDFGKQLIKEMNRLGMIIDVSHCSKLTTLEAIHESNQPVVISHANVRKISDNPRNKTDEEIKLLAENGGVIGLTPWGPLCWKKNLNQQPTINDYLDHVEYVINLVGVDHVGFGGDHTLDDKEDREGTAVQSNLYPEVVADYDQRVGTKPEVRHAKNFKGAKEIQNVVDRLKSRGYKHSDINKFLGGNFERVIKQVLKES
jgi:membrane dipeptidase